MARKRKHRKQKMSITAAVIRFLIGLLLIAILVFAGFYLLFEVDYSSRLMNSDGTYASTRAYVLPPDSTPSVSDGTEASAAPTAEATAAPTAAATEIPTEAPTETPTAQPAILISTLEPTPSPIPTASPTPTPGPTAIPTPTPVVTVEPVGARIPESEISTYRTRVKLPGAYDGEGLNVGLSRCYLSKLNYYQVMQVNGWGYIDAEGFDGRQCATFALIRNVDTGDYRVYLCTNLEGCSGRTHNAQYAQDVSNCDFQVTIDTSDFASGDYEFQIILYFEVNGRKRTYLCPFETTRTFTVVDGEIIAGLPLSD